MTDIREILKCIDKGHLIDLIIDYSDNGYFPLELFILKSDYEFSAGEIEACWTDIYEKALQFDEESDDKGADYLRDCAEMIFDQIKRLEEPDDQRRLCEIIAADLQKACEEDGIGMRSDSEWLYSQVEDKIREYIDEI